MIPQQMLNAAQTAAMLGISPSHFYKLRCTSPESLPPAIEHMSGRKIRPIWDARIVDQWLHLQGLKAQIELEKQREKIEREIASALPVMIRKVGRPRKGI